MALDREMYLIMLEHDRRFKGDVSQTMIHCGNKTDEGLDALQSLVSI